MGSDWPGETQGQAAPGGTSLSCPHFDACSGCSLEENLHRPPVREQADEFFATRVEAGDFSVRLGPPAEWRCRARLAVRPAEGGGLVVGLYRRGTHKVVEIPRCVVHHPRINQAVQLVAKAARELGTEAYDEVGGGGQLRYLQLTAAARGGDAQLPRAQDDPLAAVQVVLVWNCTEEEFDAGQGGGRELRALASRVWQGGAAAGRRPPLVHSVWANFQAARGNVILGRQWRRLHGPEHLWQAFAGAGVCFSPGSFAQVNFDMMERCLQAMLPWVPPGSAVAEFHAGVGCIGLAVAAQRAPARVTAVEVNPTVLDPYLVARQRLLADLQARGEAPPSLELRVMPAQSKPLESLAGADVVIMDPPRKGVEPELMSALQATEQHNVHTIIYLSCGFAAFMRDFDELVGCGRWRAVHSEAFIFFPGADHIETLAVFQRAEGHQAEQVAPL
eukprot:jgi/Tetstr1/420329/TSEL_011450.t1